MTELIKILFVSIIFTSLLYIPYYKIIFFKNITSNLSLIDKNILNILIIGNFVLFLSFFNISVSNIINLFYLFTLIPLFFFLKEYKENKNIFYYLLFFVFLIFILTIDLSYNLTLYWDAQKFWLPKAIHFFNNESLYGLKDLDKPQYPYFGSLIWAFFWKLSNLSHEYFGRVFYLLLLCYSIYNITDLLKITNLKKLSLFLVILFVVYDYWHLRGSQEILIFSLLLICSKYLFLFINEKRIKNEQLLIFFLSINLLIWTKNEGIFFGLFILVSLLIYSKVNLNIKIFILTIFFLLIINRYYIFNIYELKNSIADSDDFNLVNLSSSILQNLNFYNFYFISKNILISTLKFPYIILCLFFMVPILIKTGIKQQNFFIFVYLFLSVLFTYFVYFSATPYFKVMVLTGLNRLVFESSAPYLLFLIIYLKKKIEK